jgi:hypothetical protein
MMQRSCDINHWLDSSRPLLTHLAGSALYACSANSSRVAKHMMMLAVRYSPELHEVTILEAEVAPLKVFALLQKFYVNM